MRRGPVMLALAPRLCEGSRSWHLYHGLFVRPRSCQLYHGLFVRPRSCQLYLYDRAGSGCGGDAELGPENARSLLHACQAQALAGGDRGGYVKAAAVIGDTQRVARACAFAQAYEDV